MPGQGCPVERRARNLWLHVSYICGMILQSALCVYLACAYFCSHEVMEPATDEMIVVKTSWRPTLKPEERTFERAMKLLKESPDWYSIHGHHDFVRDDDDYGGDIFSYHSNEKVEFIRNIAELSCFETGEIFFLVQTVDFREDVRLGDFFYVLFRYIFDVPELIPFEQPTYGDIYLTIRIGDKKPGMMPWRRMEGGLRLVGIPGKGPATGYDPVFSFVDLRARYSRRKFDYCISMPANKTK